jgi:hypothetical protein
MFVPRFDTHRIKRSIGRVKLISKLLETTARIKQSRLTPRAKAARFGPGWEGPILNFLLDAILGMTLAAAPASDEAINPRLAEPAEIVFGRGQSETALKAEILRNIFGDEHYDWSVDLDAGTIRFTSATKIVTAPVQVIGTYNSLDGTFLWGWDHPSVSEEQAADARLARRFGERHNLPLFTTRMVECTEEQAWRFTAVALYLAGAQGSYRAPYGTTMVFVTFGNMTIAPAG